MMRGLALGLLLLQLRPLAVAGTCLIESLSVSACEMASSSGGTPGQAHKPATPTMPSGAMPTCDCATAPACGVTASTLPVAMVRHDAPSPTGDVPARHAFTTPDTVDPTAPPVPPPNS
ncbi:MAG: hypothetical protein ABIS00_08790 [Gemmatimonadales bacterium]